jgi:conjugal transfer pilus assembly protein TraU
VKRLLGLLLGFLLLLVAPAAVLAVCPDSGMLTRGGLLSTICTNCFFPMRVAGAPVGGTVLSLPDVSAPPVCICPGRFFGYPTPGYSFGMWIPTHLMDQTRTAGCSPTLGTSLVSSGASAVLSVKHGGGSEPGTKSSMYHWNLWNSPVAEMIESMQDSVCPSKAWGSEMDLAWVSFIDPTWDNETLSLFQTPEATLFASAPAVAACMVDAVASTFGKPIEALAWCNGAVGTAYPFSGIKGTHSSVVEDASLSSVKGAAMTHRRGMAHLEYGPSAVCVSHPFPMLPKQQYRYQITYPIPQIEYNHWSGTSVFKGLEFRHIPVVGEDWVMYQWTFRECCVNY